MTETTGDDGEAVRPRPDPPLSRQDQRLLAELSRPGEPIVEAAEDSELVSRAAADDSPLPASGPPPGDDPLSPVFQEPAD